MRTANVSCACSTVPFDQRAVHPFFLEALLVNDPQMLAVNTVTSDVVQNVLRVRTEEHRCDYVNVSWTCWLWIFTKYMVFCGHLLGLDFAYAPPSADLCVQRMYSG